VGAAPETARSWLGCVAHAAPSEAWPRTSNGEPLGAILDLDLEHNPVDVAPEIARVVVFSPEYADRMEDVVVRTYRRGQPLVPIATPEGVPEHTAPRPIALGPPDDSYPDRKDLPASVRAALTERCPQSPRVADRETLDSHVGGWPVWIQSPPFSASFDFALQLDTLDFEDWALGDSALVYLCRTVGDGRWFVHMDGC